MSLPLIPIEQVPPDHPDALWCLEQYFAELDVLFEAGFQRDQALPTGDGPFLLARLHGEPVGCGALKRRPAVPTEIKRMWVAPRARGLGLARRLLRELEELELRLAGGPCLIRLDTNRALTGAIRLYRAAGYREVEAFNAEPHAHHWFEKTLG